VLDQIPEQGTLLEESCGLLALTPCEWYEPVA
jgi:hypothetical protein